MMPAKNAVIVVLSGLGTTLLILIFVTRVLHESAYYFLFMIPVAVYLGIMIVRPDWLLRMYRAKQERAERDLERLDKWTPPGFP